MNVNNSLHLTLQCLALVWFGTRFGADYYNSTELSHISNAWKEIVSGRKQRRKKSVTIRRDIQIRHETLTLQSKCCDIKETEQKICNILETHYTLHGNLQTLILIMRY